MSVPLKIRFQVAFGYASSKDLVPKNMREATVNAFYLYLPSNVSTEIQAADMFLIERT